jgi:hypothetical protein
LHREASDQKSLVDASGKQGMKIFDCPLFLAELFGQLFGDFSDHRVCLVAGKIIAQKANGVQMFPVKTTPSREASQSLTGSSHSAKFFRYFLWLSKYFFVPRFSTSLTAGSKQSMKRTS